AGGRAPAPRLPGCPGWRPGERTPARASIVRWRLPRPPAGPSTRARDFWEPPCLARTRRSRRHWQAAAPPAAALRNRFHRADLAVGRERANRVAWSLPSHETGAARG